MFTRRGCCIFHTRPRYLSQSQCRLLSGTRERGRETRQLASPILSCGVVGNVSHLDALLYGSLMQFAISAESEHMVAVYLTISESPLCLPARRRLTSLTGYLGPHFAVHHCLPFETNQREQSGKAGQGSTPPVLGVAPLAVISPAMKGAVVQDAGRERGSRTGGVRAKGRVIIIDLFQGGRVLVSRLPPRQHEACDYSSHFVLLTCVAQWRAGRMPTDTEWPRLLVSCSVAILSGMAGGKFGGWMWLYSTRRKKHGNSS